MPETHYCLGYQPDGTPITGECPPWMLALIVDIHKIAADLRSINQTLKYIAARGRDRERQEATEKG